MNKRKKEIVAISIVLVIIASVAAMLSAIAAAETTYQAIKITYQTHEDGSFVYEIVHPQEIEIKGKDDTFFLAFDFDPTAKKYSALYTDLEYAELTPYDEFISVEMRDEEGRKGTYIAYRKIQAVSDWGQLQIIVKESGGQKQTIKAHVVFVERGGIYEEASNEGDSNKPPSVFEVAIAVVVLLVILFVLKIVGKK